MKLVLVHGRAQAGKDPIAIQKEWMDALGYGALRANKTIPTATEIVFPFYGNELERLVAHIDAPLAATAKGTDSDVDTDLRGQILEDIAAQIGVSRADIEREFKGQPTRKGPGNWEWVHAILRAMDKIPGVNSASIDQFTRDVYVYLTYPAVRGAIDKIVTDQMSDGPCVVVGHSLGTVVAYNVLLRRSPADGIRRYVTLGSPLGIRGIKRYLDSPVACPSCVGSWFNAYDDRDLVALVPLDTKNFDVHPAIENKSDVMNFTDNRHGIAGYLADPMVAAKILEFL
jgi:hypothetical protein